MRPADFRRSDNIAGLRYDVLRVYNAAVLDGFSCDGNTFRHLREDVSGKDRFGVYLGVSGIVNACIIVGFANGINIILTDGKIMDTIIYYFTMPLQNLSPLICAPLMIIIQSLVNFFVSSGSAQVVVMMPLMVPIADLLEVNRQVAVLAYQVGDGLPT